MKENFQVLQDAYHQVQHGWAKGHWTDDSGNKCLLESIIVSLPSILKSIRQAEIPSSILLDLDKELIHYPTYKFAKRSGSTLWSETLRTSSEEEKHIIHGIVFWNDTPWRRKKTVAALLERLALKNEVIWLRTERQRLALHVSSLETKVIRLESEIESLRNENRFFSSLLKKRNLGQKQKELEKTSLAIGQTYQELETVGQRLEEKIS